MTQTMEKTTLRPLGARVVAVRLEAEETLKGGIILPDSAKKKQETVRIVAVAKDEENLKVGDHVLIDKYAGQEVEVDGTEYVIVKTEDVIAAIEE